jgi:threonine dehydratase
MPQENLTLQPDIQPPAAPVRAVRMPTTDDLARARAVVASHLRPTPMIRSGAAWLKLDSLQPTGSFKVRGAIAALSAAPAGSRIVAASAGNHALGIAFASEALGVPATVVIAENASPAKRAYLEQRRVTLIRYGQSVVEAEIYAIGLTSQAAEPAVYVSPYNDPQVIAGQSTVLDEIIAAMEPGPRPRPLRIVVPVGGGGLLSGIALRAAELGQRGWDIELIGVEASESRAVSTAVTVGETIDVEIGETIADGLSGNIEPGSITVDIIRRHVERIVHVDDGALRETIRWLIREHGIVAEGAGAAAFAAVRQLALAGADRETVAIVSGKNIATDVLFRILSGAPHDTKRNTP